MDDHAGPGSADPFDDATLVDPYGWYRALGRAPVPLTHPTLRQTGSRLLAVAGNEEVKQALSHPDTFSSVGSPGVVPIDDPVRTGVVLSSDPPEHGKYRRTMERSMAPRGVAAIAEEALRRATALVSEVCARGRFDAVRDLAAPYSLGLVGDRLGLPPDGRERILQFAVDGFNLFGPRNSRAMDAIRVLDELPAYLASAMSPEKLAHGWGHAIWKAVDDGEITVDEATSLLGVYLIAGIHTTVSGIASAIALLARHPAQWSAVRAQPDGLAAKAFHEALRMETPIQWVGRGVTRTVELGGVTLTPGERVLLMLGAANRDPRYWTDPDVFDINHLQGRSVAFGAGPHHCVGRVLAVIQGTAMLRALARRVRTLEPDGDPTLTPHNVLRGYDAVPVAVTIDRGNG